MRDSPEGRTPEILLIEDSAADARLIDEAFRAKALDYNLHVVPDGIEARSFLQREKPYSDAVKPDLIILDLNLPRSTGRDVLRSLKTDPAFRHVRRTPIVVLTTSNHEEDIADCYENYANCYIVKPMSIPEYFDIVDRINTYWFSTVALPPPV